MPVVAPNGTALVLCSLDRGQLARARADTTLTVCPSLHSDDPAPAVVVSAYAEGLAALTSTVVAGAPNAPMRTVLGHLTALHLAFEPED